MKLFLSIFFKNGSVTLERKWTECEFCKWQQTQNVRFALFSQNELLQTLIHWKRKIKKRSIWQRKDRSLESLDCNLGNQRGEGGGRVQGVHPKVETVETVHQKAQTPKSAGDSLSETVDSPLTHLSSPLTQLIMLNVGPISFYLRYKSLSESMDDDLGS